MILQAKRLFGAVRCVDCHGAVHHCAKNLLMIVQQHSVMENRGIRRLYQFAAFELWRYPGDVVGLPLAGRP